MVSVPQSSQTKFFELSLKNEGANFQLLSKRFVEKHNINIIYNGPPYLPDFLNCLLIMFVKMHSNLAEAHLRNFKFFDIQQKKTFKHSLFRG